jgi:hypothetical protein
LNTSSFSVPWTRGKRPGCFSKSGLLRSARPSVECLEDRALPSATTVSIIDDSNQGFSTTGHWDLWTNGGYLGDVHEATGRTGADVASWTFNNLTAGLYRVSVTWTPWPDRASNAPYTVLDGSTVLGSAAVNQLIAPVGLSDAGAFWQDLGNFQVHGNGLVVQLSDAANGNVIADAVRVEWLGPIPQGPAVQVLDSSGLNVPGGTGSVNTGSTFLNTLLSRAFTVDNIGTQPLQLSGPITLPAGFSLAAGFGSTTLAPGASTSFTVRLDATTPGAYGGLVSFATNDPNHSPFTFSLSGTVSTVDSIDDSNPGFSTTGSWTQWTNGGYLGNVHEATGGTGADVASWTFGNLAPGQYRVSVTWTPFPDRASNAPYTVLDGSTVLGKSAVNQQVAPAGLTDAGATWQDLGTFQVHGTSLVVQLSDAANGNVIADAVRIEWLGPLPQPLGGGKGHSHKGGDKDDDDKHERPEKHHHQHHHHKRGGEHEGRRAELLEHARHKELDHDGAGTHAARGDRDADDRDVAGLAIAISRRQTADSLFAQGLENEERS